MGSGGNGRRQGRHWLSLLYLFDALITGDEPFASDLQLIVELDGLHLALPTLDGGELQLVAGDAE